MRDMYRYLAVLLASHLTNVSIYKAKAVFRELGYNSPLPKLVRFIGNHLLAFSATSRLNLAERFAL
jgi:hypothetical protein